MQIEIKDIYKSYGRKKVLDGVSLQAQGGQCIGILGANGTGKTTLLSILAGVQGCRDGKFMYDGEDLFANEKKRAALVGYVPQGTPLIEELTAWDNLLLWYDRKRLSQELESGILKLLGIKEFLRLPVGKMSGGMKKRLSIGCAMGNKQPVLLLDEPTAALDMACRQIIFSYLQTYKRSGGLILLTTHDAQELALCDQLYILKNGKLSPYAFEGDMDALIRSL